MTKYLLPLLALPSLATAICLHLFGGYAESNMLYRKNDSTWRWNKVTGEFDKLEALVLNSRAFCSVQPVNDLRGKTLTVDVNPLDPLIILTANHTKITGFIGDMWVTMEGALGFKTIYRRLRWEKILKRETTAVLSALTMQDTIIKYFAWSTPFSSNAYSLFVQSEGLAKVSKKWYVKTFSDYLWLLSYLFFVCMACCMTLSYYVKKHVCANYQDLNDELASPIFSLFYIFGGVTGQGFFRIPRSWSLRLILLSCLTMGLLLTCGFNSSLTSELANRKFSVPISNLQDVMTKRTHILCLRNDSNAYTHFTVDGTLDGDLKDEWKGIVNEGCPDMEDTATFASKLCRPGFVYLEVPNVFRSVYNQVKQNCSILQMPGDYWRRKMAFIHARSAPHQQLINTYILRMGMSGILNYLQKKWFPKHQKSVSQHLDVNIFQPVEYEHIHLAFYGFSVMVVVSVIICILENIWHKLRTRKEVARRNFHHRTSFTHCAEKFRRRRKM